jgi:hypothetical protein
LNTERSNNFKLILSYLKAVKCYKLIVGIDESYTPLSERIVCKLGQRRRRRRKKQRQRS